MKIKILNIANYDLVYDYSGFFKERLNGFRRKKEQ